MVSFKVLLTALLCVTITNALSLDTSSKDSICAAAKEVQQGEWNYYEGTTKGGTVGMFVPPYYWWHAGEAFGGLLNYYMWCDPDNLTLEELIYNGMYHQAGDNYDYIPRNQSMTEGNDDQGVWGMAVMEAAERNFTNPPDHSWFSMAQAIFNTMNSRWDSAHCGGGLRWQIFTWNSGYDYKNTISNGCLFHIAARLARYSGNDSYSDVASKVWDWMDGVGFINEDDKGMEIWDGAMITNNCTDFTKLRWSYIYGILMSGAAYMYNFTGDHVWQTRAEGILLASSYFLNDSLFTEMSCAPGDHCNTDQRTFRSLFARGLMLTSVMCPDTASKIDDLMQKNALAAAQSCSGGSDHVTCGENWAVSGWDGVYGLGEQMSALETILGLLAHQEPVPLTVDTGGNSQGNANAGLDTYVDTNKNVITVTGKDKAGAGILTAVACAVILGGAIWMVL